MGINESFFLGKGWHDCTRDGRFNLPYRPADKISHVYLPDSIIPLSEISILVASSPSLLGKPIKGRVFLSNCPIYNFLIEDDYWRVWNIPIDNAVVNYKSPILSFEMDETFVPNVVLKNGDYRSLGLYVSMINFMKFS